MSSSTTHPAATSHSLPPTPDAFRAEVEAFFATHAATETASGSEVIPVIGSDEDEHEIAEAAQLWRARLFDAGLGWITGPSQYGGRDLPAEYETIFHEVEARYSTPDQGVFQVARGMISPAVLTHGSQDLKDRVLPGVHRGEVICCQLLSEPEAGSDLGALRTTAVRDGDEWLVNGQKVWSSFAHVAQIGQLVARTDPSVPKHKGLTMFLLPMDTPGLTIRPLRQMNGGAHFNEVFFDDVRVADSQRVGAPGEGWSAVMTTLMNERHAVAERGESPDVVAVKRLLDLVRARDLSGDPCVRAALAEIHTHQELLRFLQVRKHAAVSAGREPGPEGSIAKLMFSTQLRRIANFALSVAGPGGVADAQEPFVYAWSNFLCSAPGLRIAGGTDEIQRNTIAERVLGLPKEPLGN